MKICSCCKQVIPELPSIACKICGEVITPKRADQVICLKPECKKQHTKNLIAGWRHKNKEYFRAYRKKMCEILKRREQSDKKVIDR